MTKPTARLEAAVYTALRDFQQTDVTPPPALTDVGRMRSRVQVLEEDAERSKGLAKVGSRCMREGHQGQIESGRATVEGHRFALSVRLGLGTGAPWDAIHEHVAELRRLADETPDTQPPTETCAHCGKTIRRVTGTLAAWWVHDPGGNTVCDWARAATSHRATPPAETPVQSDHQEQS